MRRVLKKNGRLLLKEFTIETFTLPGLGYVLQHAMPHPYDSMFDQIELLTHVRKTGFEITHQNDSLFSLMITALRKG